LAINSQTKLQVTGKNCSQAGIKQFLDEGHPKVTLGQKTYFSLLYYYSADFISRRQFLWGGGGFFGFASRS
jgi:hypothetical protein